MNALALAIDLAKQAGALQRARLGDVRSIEMKGLTDPVTDVDKACEALILAAIHAQFPAHAILAEESGASANTEGAEWRWIIDPLDGTVNFAHGYPLFCVCIALQHRGQTELGVIYEPNRDELFVAERGRGATRNGTRMRVSPRTKLIESLFATGFAYGREQGELAINIPIFNRMLMEARAVRRDGVAGVDLAYVACGRFDGFWEFYLRPWDLAAGVLLVEEAGGRVTNIDGAPFDLFGTQVLATNGVLHDALQSTISAVLRASPRAPEPPRLC